MRQILEENEKELEDVEEEYTQTSLHNAEAVDYMIEEDPSVLNSVQQLRKIADMVEVDEIHIFDQTGRIFTGTHPEYYDYTFDSGEQMNFFKPMLEDKSLELVQDITPNTAEGKLMQYSAIWSKSGEFIVEVGMAPENVEKVTQKNELSYIFSLLRVNPVTNYYAVDKESGEILGSTNLQQVGKTLKDVNLQFDSIEEAEKGFFARVNGVECYCVFTEINTEYIGYVTPREQLYQRIPNTILMLTLSLLLIAIAMIIAVSKCMDHFFVKGIQKVNRKLRLIEEGNLDETVDINDSQEFCELSYYINHMVKRLLNNNKKMSYVLSKTNRYIGVYEYNEGMKKIRFTEYIPQLLMINDKKAEELSNDLDKFQNFMKEIYKNPLPDEPGIYHLNANVDHYVRIEEVNDGNEIYGVILDETDEVKKRRKIEKERDIDPLTGLYNRRGIDNQITKLLEKPEELGYAALVMVDADGLKGINDTYGHEKGDLYLQQIADTLRGVCSEGCLVARQGGDEFVLFLYQYESEEELDETIRKLEYVQDHSEAQLDEQLKVSLSFSFGYSLTKENTDYDTLMAEADEKMYQNKRSRKKNRK
jgi:diguanylate cyclase (GGDEF)-like protein